MSLLDLEVHLATREGAFRGRCLDLGSGEDEILASVEFESERAPLLRLGETTELEFRAQGTDFCVSTDALTVLRTDDASRRCYCFRATLSKRVLLHLLNRRRMLRIRLPPSRSLHVSILDLGDPAPEAIVHDVSTLGVSILLEPAIESQIFDRLHMRLAVRLPADEEAIEMLATIRHRRLFGTAVLYGLEIDGQLPDFMRAKEKFLLYVASLRKHGNKLAG